jgi:hypothetical protein
MLRNIPEEQISHLQCSGSLKSHVDNTVAEESAFSNLQGTKVISQKQRQQVSLKLVAYLSNYITVISQKTMILILLPWKSNMDNIHLIWLNTELPNMMLSLLTECAMWIKWYHLLQVSHLEGGFIWKTGDNHFHRRETHSFLHKFGKVLYIVIV